MRTETELTPFVPGSLEGSPLLVLAPHPDDEVFGCGGLLAQACASGAAIRVVIVTDGQAQGEESTRRAESKEAARRLGLPEPEFWGLADRGLEPDDAGLVERLQELLLEVRPHLLLVPSPAEIHPDHRALALAVFRILQRATSGSALHVALQSVRLACYEVSAVMRPNMLIDITAQWPRVLEAAEAFTSQVERLPYLEVLQAMASARRLTLPAEVEWAEAYHVADLRYIRTHSLTEWAAAQGPIAELESVTEAVPLDVVVRTRNRPQLLAEALESVLAQLHAPARLIVVNDGGVNVEEVCATAARRLDLDLVQWSTARGRSAAAQRGLGKATASHVVFLDDDDLFLAEHLLLLGQAVGRGAAAPYTDAVQGIWRYDDSGRPQPVARHRTFKGEFDPARLALANHIPLPTIAIPRELALEVGGFDPELDLYEDWDLLLRLARRTPFLHLPRVTCEYRVIAEAGTITGANPPGSAGQLKAMLSIWRKHGLTRRPERLTKGVVALLAERDAAAEQARLLDEELIQARGELDGLEVHVRRMGAARDRSEAEVAAARAEIERLGNDVARMQQADDARAATEASLRAEIERLTNLLETIYASKTWKMHQLVERLRRRR